jgi:hypothetical protein
MMTRLAWNTPVGGLPSSQRARQAITICGVLALSGCSGLFDVDTQIITVESLGNALGAEALSAGAIGTFADAFGSQVTFTGAMADEFFATSVGSALAEANERTGAGYPYASMQRARISSLDAIAAFQLRSPASRGRSLNCSR